MQHPRRMKLVAAGMAGTVLAGLAMGPALADTETVTFTVSSGSLTIDASASADLGSSTNLVAGTTVSGALGNVVVTDTRNATLGWVSSAASTDFTKVGGTIAKANSTVSGVSSLVSSTGLAVVGGFTGSAASMAAAGGAIGTAVALGSNTATFNPTMSIAVPVDTPAGDYTGTLTISVL